MIQLAEKLGMKISTNFVDFIEKEVLPNTNVTAEKFWHGLATLVNELTPQNKALLDKRRYLQKQINEWHELNSNNDIDLAEYKEFLYSIGYLVPKGESFFLFPYRKKLFYFRHLLNLSHKERHKANPI